MKLIVSRLETFSKLSLEYYKLLKDIQTMYWNVTANLPSQCHHVLLSRDNWFIFNQLTIIPWRWRQILIFLFCVVDWHLQPHTKQGYYAEFYKVSLARISFNLLAACWLSTLIYLIKAAGLLWPDIRISSPAGKPDRYILVQKERLHVCEEIISHFSYIFFSRSLPF